MSGHFDHDFPLDEFQRRAAEVIGRGENVLVAAPTGSGKTVIGEQAIDAALRRGDRAFYTTPIKALSNQKYRDLCGALGSASVGLMTGDRVVNPDADAVVMTTEVLRNMLYAGSPALEGLGWVVLDEVHFLSDTYRGAVWEEVLIHTPARVRFACLSATVSNSAELGGWIGSLRGPTTTIVEHHRPVELEVLYLVGDRHAEEDHLLPMLVEGSPNPRGEVFDRDAGDPAGRGRHRNQRSRGSRFARPRRTEVVERLSAESLLPAIYFVFSRKGCDEAARRCLHEGLRLTDATEAERIRELLEHSTEGLAERDLEALDYAAFAETASRGIAAHHAGMVPAFREGIERCFTEGLIKVVFATETLALGINMPARSVVIEQLTKFTGDTHAMLTAAQFTQLTGRAGRRGIDDHGAAIVLWSPWVRFGEAARLAASREFPLASSFRPTYNMVANLVARHGEQEAREVLGRSFAQYRAEASSKALRLRIRELEAERDEALATLSDLGADPDRARAYTALLREHRSASARRAPRIEVERSLAGLRPGDVIEQPDGSKRRLLLVIATSQRKQGTRVDAVTTRGRRVRIHPGDPREPVEALGHIELPVPHAPHDAEFQRKCGAQLRRVNPKRLRSARSAAGARESEVRRTREALEMHDLHAHPQQERVVAAVSALTDAESALAGERRKLDTRGGDLLVRFDSVRSVLEEFGHLEGWHLTAPGRRLRSIFHESDLLTSLAVGEGLLDGLEPRDAAALLSCITHEHRGSERPPRPRLPNRELQERFWSLAELHATLARAERARRLPESPEPAAGFARAAWRWCDGAPLSECIGEEMSGGDFVRGARNLGDLSAQVARVTSGATSAAMSVVAEMLQRDLLGSGTPT